MHANKETTTEGREEEEPVATGDNSMDMHSVAKRPFTEEHLNKRSMAEYVLLLRAQLGFPQSSVNTVIETTQSLLSAALSIVKEKISDRLKETGMADCDIKASIDVNVEDSFESLSSAKLQMKYFQSEFNYVI